MSVRSAALAEVNKIIRPLSFQLVHSRTADPAIQSFIPAKSTLAAARAAGVPLADYIDRHHAQPGATAAAVDQMLAIGHLSGHVERVCEIGPGTGRFAEKIIDLLHPDVYEIYETAKDWLPHLQQLPHAMVQPCDGRTLAATPSGTVDLVHAQKVFVYTTFTTSVGYLQEMSRVVHAGGVVAFDVITEDCLDDDTVNSWLRAGVVMFRPIPRQWLVDYLARIQLTLVGHFFTPMTFGRTEMLVLRRT